MDNKKSQAGKKLSFSMEGSDSSMPLPDDDSVFIIETTGDYYEFVKQLFLLQFQILIKKYKILYSLFCQLNVDHIVKESFEHKFANMFTILMQEEINRSLLRENPASSSSFVAGLYELYWDEDLGWGKERNIDAEFDFWENIIIPLGYAKNISIRSRGFQEIRLNFVNMTLNVDFNLPLGILQNTKQLCRGPPPPPL